MPDPSSLPENRREAGRWLDLVYEEIDVARAAAALPRLGSAAYHLQQAAEKLVKCLLVLNAQPFRRTHDLDELVGRLTPFYPHLVPRLDMLRPLTVWGVAYRYPALEDEPEPLPSTQELLRSAAVLTALAAEAATLVKAQ